MKNIEDSPFLERILRHSFSHATRSSASVCLSTLAVFVFLTGQCMGQDILVKKGDSIAFLGDSITAKGWAPGGYIKLVIDGLEKQGVKATPIPAGVSGNKSNDMLDRLDRDVLNKNPTWMTLSCGVNDVWHGKNGVPLDDYKKNISTIVEKAQAQGINVIILTATPIGEDDNANNQKLADYNEFLRTLAKKHHFLLADLSEDFKNVLGKLSTHKDSRYLTVDGVHMNPEGNVLMAKGCLRAFGLSEAQLKDVEQSWLSQANTAQINVYPFDPRPKFGITLGQFRALKTIAGERHTPIVNLTRSLWLQALSQAVQDHVDEPVLDAEQVKKDANAKLLATIEKLTK